MRIPSWFSLAIPRVEYARGGINRRSQYSWTEKAVHPVVRGGGQRFSSILVECGTRKYASSRNFANVASLTNGEVHQLRGTGRPNRRYFCFGITAQSPPRCLDCPLYSGRNLCQHAALVISGLGCYGLFQKPSGGHSPC